jgi:hypothetical protein
VYANGKGSAGRFALGYSGLFLQREKVQVKVQATSSRFSLLINEPALKTTQYSSNTPHP